MITIQNLNSNSTIELDENTTLDTIQQTNHPFFKNKHGQRETYIVYKGCLIVRNTINYTHGKQRETVVYTYCTKTQDLFCVSVGSKCGNTRQAKKLIDTLLSKRTYKYGFFK